MDEPEIAPEWACRVFCERANLNYDAVLSSPKEMGPALRSAVKAGGLLIARHEDPPADPLAADVQELADELRINLSAMPWVEGVLFAGLRRGIEIAKQGEGA